VDPTPVHKKPSSVSLHTPFGRRSCRKQHLTVIHFLPDAASGLEIVELHSVFIPRTRPSIGGKKGEEWQEKSGCSQAGLLIRRGTETPADLTQKEERAAPPVRPAVLCIQVISPYCVSA